MSSEEARDLAVGISAGQSYVGRMHVVVILTARFFRNQWKYRRNLHTYRVSIMDAAHLSQTFYLTATELGLGAFFSAAINAPMIEESLSINGYEEGALGLCGCGIKAGQGRGELPFDPYLPPQAEPS
jgi:SagB-type dehydrogenase family enzyme